MRDYRKIAALALSALLFLGFVLVSCTPSSVEQSSPSQQNLPDQSASSGESLPPVEEKIDLGGYKFTIASIGTSAPNPESPTYEEEMELLRSIEKKYNITLDFFWFDNWQEYTNQYLVTAMAGTPFGDVCWQDSGLMYPAAVVKGLVIPLDDIFDFSNPMWNHEYNEQMMYEGKHYGITQSQFGAGSGIAFNKALLARFGLKSPYEYVKEGNWTWETFRELAKAATRDGIYGIASQSTGAIVPHDFVYTNGGSSYVIDENGKVKFALDDPRAIEAIQFAYDLWNVDNVVDHGPEDAEYAYGEKQFRKGLALFFHAASYNIGLYNRDLDDQVGFVWLPKGPRVDDYVNFSSSLSAMFIPPNTTYPEYAGKIITDWYAPYEWRAENSYSRLESQFRDEDALAIALEMPSKTAPNMLYTPYEWYRNWVLWSDMGVKAGMNPQQYIEEVKVMAQKSIDDTWAGLDE